MLSPEIQVLISPERAYAAFAGPTRGGAWTAVRRPLFVALVQGVVISMVATRTVAAPVVLSVTLAWAIAIVIQFTAATLLIVSAPQRQVNVAHALDLFFLGHAPWTLWLLACGAALTWASAVSGLPWIAVVTMIVPGIVTARIVAAYSRVVLRLSRRAARARTAVHQGAMWAVFVLFIASAIQLWPRVIGYLE